MEAIYTKKTCTQNGGIAVQLLNKRNWLTALLMLLLMTALLVTGCASDGANTGTENGTEPHAAGSISVTEQGQYTAPQDVADYLHRYGHLPDNFITKKEAKALGWDNQAGNLDEVAPGKSIGGDSFSNREGLLPKEKGRSYWECDVNYTGGYRGSERLIYSSDGLIFYTDDHYKSFEQLY